MANIAMSGGVGFAGGAINGAIAGSAATGPFAAFGALGGALVGGLIGGALGAGAAALATLLGRPKSQSTRHSQDIITTSTIRNTPVAVCCGRNRLGGNWIEIGWFEVQKDFRPGAAQAGLTTRTMNGILGLCEGPIQTCGNIRQDGQTIRHFWMNYKVPLQYLQYTPHFGSKIEVPSAEQLDGKHGYDLATQVQIGFRNTATLLCVAYCGQDPKLNDVNIDIVGPDYTIHRGGLTGESSSGDVAIYALYDGYTQNFYYPISSSGIATAPFGMVQIGRTGGLRDYTAPPAAISGSPTKQWYLGRHDILVMQDPHANDTFFVGYWGITSTSTDWKKQKLWGASIGQGYANPILLFHLDERHGILHTLHNDGTVRYILRWHLLTGRIDRTDTDLASANWKAMCYSVDLGAYLVASDTFVNVVSGDTGQSVRNITSISTSSCVGVFYCGQQVGVVSTGFVEYFDMYTKTLHGPYGQTASDPSQIGSFGNAVSAFQNTYTGHVTMVWGYTGSPACVNFIPSCMEDRRDINANGTSGLGTAPSTSPSQNGSAELDFQDIANVIGSTNVHVQQVFQGTGNVVGSRTYPPNDPIRDWCRDWSYRTYSQWALNALEGNSCLAGFAYAACVSVPEIDSSRWGAGLDPSYFSLSSFESLHSYCVGPVTMTNADGSKRLAERYKFDYTLESEVALSSLISETILVCCQGYRYTMGGVVHVDVPRMGMWPTWHFSDRNTNEDSFSINFVGRADGVNRVRVLYRDVLDEYRHNYAEAEDLADINMRGRVQHVEINAEGCGRFDSADLLAKAVLDQSTAGRRQPTFKTHFAGLMITPGDAVEISNVKCGLSRMPARVTSVKEEAEGKGAGAVEVEAIEWHSTLDSLDDQNANPTGPGSGPIGPPDSNGFVIAGPTGGNKINWYNNKQTFSAGSYTIVYQNGAYSPTPSRFQQSSPGVYPSVGWLYAVYGYTIVTLASNHTTVIGLGPTPGKFFANPGWTSLSEAETENAGQFGTFTLAVDGPIGIRSPNNMVMPPDAGPPTFFIEDTIDYMAGQ